MNKRRLKFMIWMLSVSCWISSGLVLFWTWRTPAQSGAASAVSPRLAHYGVEPILSDEIGSYARLWTLDLRRPLFDPPPTPPAPVVQPAPSPLLVKLAGTVIETSGGVGIFQLPDGQIEMKRVGESVGGAQILQIEQDKAVLRHHGQDVTLSLPKEGQS